MWSFGPLEMKDRDANSKPCRDMRPIHSMSPASLTCAHLVPTTVDSTKYGLGTIYGGFPSFVGFRFGGRSYSNFLASTVPRTI